MRIDFSNMEEARCRKAQEIYKALNAYKENCELTSIQISPGEREEITHVLEEMLGKSLEEQIEIGRLSDGAWLCTAYRILFEIVEPFLPKNSFDREFLDLINLFRNTSTFELFQQIWGSVLQMREKQGNDLYERFVKYFELFPFWGTLNPDDNDFDTIIRRAEVLKRHSYDFLWLYRRLSDYLSKRTLLAILRNWLSADVELMLQVKSIFPDYFEPDIFPDNKDDIFVDVGAYVGDTIADYVTTYGLEYKKIYAYEILMENCKQMKENGLESLHDLEIRRKGAGRKRGDFFITRNNAFPSANQLSDLPTEEKVEVVALDEDIPDGFTFLKMDIEGAEFDALLGSERTIRRCHPKLAICVYHGYDDLWRIPALIDDFNSDYKFYFRYNGESRMPTEFVLLAKE